MSIKLLESLIFPSAFAKANLGFTLGNCLVRAISFLSIPIFTYLLSVEDYGLVTTFFAYQAIFGLFTGLSLHTSVLSANREFPGEIKDYLSSITTFQILLFVLSLSVFGIYFCYEKVFFHFSFLSIVLLLLLSLTLNFQASFKQYLSISYDYKKTLLINLATSCGGILFSILLILTLFSDERGLGRIVGVLIATSFVSAYILIGLFKESSPRLNWRYVRFGCSYSTPVIAHGLSREVLNQFPKIIIQMMVGNFAVGLYGFAFTIAAIPQLIGTSLDTVWSAWFFEHFEKNKNAIRERAIAYLMVFSSLVVFLIAICPELVFFLAPSSYEKATEIVVPALMCAYALFLFYFPGAVEYYKKRTKLIALASTAAATLNVILIYFCVPRFGYVSAVYVSLATYVVYVASHTLIAHWLVPNLYDYLKMGELVCITVILALISQFFLDSLAIRLFACSIAFILIIYLNRFLVKKHLCEVSEKLKVSSSR